jgi:hypothetical protein
MHLPSRRRGGSGARSDVIHQRVIAAGLALLLVLQASAAFGSDGAGAHASTPGGGVMPSTAGSTQADTGQVIRTGGGGAVRVGGSAAAGACQVATGSGGGVVSSCPDAASYAEFVDGLDVAFDDLSAQGNTSALSITSEPAGADVSLNGTPVGTTPLEAKVRAGSYVLRITKDGYQPYSRSVTASAARPALLSATLQAAGGGTGSFEWVRAEQLLAVLGADGFPDGTLDIAGFVTDKDGNDYISFYNTSKAMRLQMPGPEEACPGIIGDPQPCNFQSFQEFVDSTVTVGAVAQSQDSGRTWRLLKSWRSRVQSRAWTSPRFIDSQWSHGDPGGIKEHWIHAYYRAWESESFSITALVPRPEGGINVTVQHNLVQQPQSVELYYDNLPSTYCRTDDLPNGPDPERKKCHGFEGIISPGRYIGTVAVDLPRELNLPIKSAGTDEARARYGFGETDFTTFNLVRKTTEVTFNTATLAQREVDPAAWLGVKYQASFDGTDYWFAVGDDSKSRVFTATNGGDPMLQATYSIPDSPRGRNATQRLEIGADGTVYLIDVNFGRVYRLDGSAAILLGAVPPARYGDLTGSGVPGFYTLAAAVDGGGNVHAAYRVGVVPPDARFPSTVNVFYAFFAREPVKYDGVALFTEPGCDACDATREWLTAAGVSFRENPTDLPADLGDSVAAAKATGDYPIVARLGADSVVLSAAAPAAVSRLLAVTYPVLVESHRARVQRGDVNGYQPDWVLMVLEGDTPRVIVQRDEGVVAYAESGPVWKPEKLMDPLPLIKPVTYRDGSTTAFSFNPRDPQFPARFERVSDLTLLHRAESFPEVGRFSYQLWTTKARPESSTYRAVTQVSQLIPTGALDVELGEKGKPPAQTTCDATGKSSAVQGELCGYVKSEDLVVEGGRRIYRVVVEIRDTGLDGNIVARTIGGAVDIETETEEGAPETRSISLLLLVENHRLVFWDPSLSGAAHDISTETVHFTGSDERWVVVNNLGLANSIDCGEDQALYLPAHSLSTYTAETAKSYDLTCLSALEVAPTPVDGCTTWDEVKAKLAAETIDALAQSLPLLRSTSRVTNWELAFGSRDATVRRIVSVDNVPPPGGAGRCASEVDGKTAAVIEISGRILGGAGENYAPTVTVGESGTAAVMTASLARPRNLAWERQWLELESAFLEAQLRMSVANAALLEALTLRWDAKRIRYQHWLLATRALLHCNAEGQDMTSVMLLVDRLRTIPDANRGTAGCFQDFLVNPASHWQGYDPRLISTGYRVRMLTLIHDGVVSNPTLAFLASGARGGATLYTRFLFDHARALETSSSLSVNRYDYAFDDYARALTAVSRQMSGPRGALTNLVLATQFVPRRGLVLLAECTQAMGSGNPFPRLLELTSKQQYTAGLPCVDNAGAGQAKVDAYRTLRIALHGDGRSSLYRSIASMSGGDADLIKSYLDMARSVVKEVEATEDRYGPDTQLTAWSDDLPVLDQFLIIKRHYERLAEERGKRISVGDAVAALKGVAQCAVGLVQGLLEDTSIALVMLGILAFEVVGGGAAATAGLIFIGSGAVFSGIAAKDLVQAWADLDTTERTAGICSTAVSALMTIVPARGAWETRNAVRRGEFVGLEARHVITLEAVQNTESAAGLTATEQAKSFESSGGTIAVEPPPAPPPPVDPALKAVIDRLPEGRRPVALAAADGLGYSDMTQLQQQVLRDYLATADSYGGAAQYRQFKIFELTAQEKTGTPEFTAYDEVGAALVDPLGRPLPKSIAVEEAPAEPASSGHAALPPRRAGSDASIMAAADNAARVPSDVLPSLRDTVAARQPYLLEAIFGSERMLDALKGLRDQLMTPKEADAIFGRVQAVRPGATDSFFRELSGTRVVEAMRASFAEALRLAKKTGQEPTDIHSSLLRTGQSKVAVRVTVALADGSSIELVAAKGAITAEEAAVYRKYGPLDITQKLLSPLLERVDGDQALLFTEYFAGRKVAEGPAGILELLNATGDLEYAAAIGELDARIWFRTQEPGSGLADYNSDLHVGNINVFESGGKADARAIDMDPRYTMKAAERAYWAARLVSRAYDAAAEEALMVKNFDGMAEGVIRGFEKNGRSRADAIDLLRRTRAALDDSAAIAEAEAVQGPDIINGAAVARTRALLDDFLARNGGARLPHLMVVRAVTRDLAAELFARRLPLAA